MFSRLILLYIISIIEMLIFYGDPNNPPILDLGIMTIGVDSGGHAPPIIKIGGQNPFFAPPNNQTRIKKFLIF